RAGAGTDSVAFARDSKSLLCIAREDARLQLWDLEAGRQVWSRADERADPKPPVDAMFLAHCSFGPGDREYVVSIDNSWGKSVYCLCDLEAGTIRKELASFSESARFAASPNGKWLAVVGHKGVVEFWDARTGRLIRRSSGNQTYIRGLEFSPDSRLVASGAG